MFCPKCGASQNEALKFCNLCGANLYAVRQVVDSRETNEKFDWSKTWVAEMFLSESERKKREAELDLQRGITPHVKRLNEIKAGIITSSVGVAVAIFLYVFMKGIILGGNVSSGDAEILSRIWVAGIIPFMVGVGLMINGIFVSKRLVQLADKAAVVTDQIDREFEARSLHAAHTTEFPSPPYGGVTEGTTRHLSTSGSEIREKQT